MSAPARIIALYALMYAAFGVSSPFMPAFLAARGLGPEQLGLLFATGTAVRLISGPLCGRLADLTRARRGVLVICIALAALVAFGLSFINYALDEVTNPRLRAEKELNNVLKGTTFKKSRTRATPVLRQPE